ncbi:MAG: DUF3344 domain-containing protein [Candidatus Methanospirareceae archaeon]
MSSPSRSSALLVALILLTALAVPITPVSGSYAGDKPLGTVAHDACYGDVVFTLGESTYSGLIEYNDTYTVTFDTSAVAGKAVKLARLYVYWVWSQKENVGVYPTLELRAQQSVLNAAVTYTDTKGFVGRYDYFSGVTVYECTQTLASTNQDGDTIAVTVMNADPTGSTFSLQGIGLLVVAECMENDRNCPSIEYWINEGCDMIYADYGITPEMATSTSYFNGEIAVNNVEKATLITVVPSGGYVSGGEKAHNTLYFNEESGWLKELPFLKQLLKLLFGVGGGAWNDVYIADNTVQIGVDQRDVTEYLKASNNFVAVQDQHDYMMVTNAILVMEQSVER